MNQPFIRRLPDAMAVGRQSSHGFDLWACPVASSPWTRDRALCCPDVFSEPVIHYIGADFVSRRYWLVGRYRSRLPQMLTSSRDRSAHRSHRDLMDGFSPKFIFSWRS